jgi:hypothetical protein
MNHCVELPKLKYYYRVSSRGGKVDYYGNTVVELITVEKCGMKDLCKMY